MKSITLFITLAALTITSGVTQAAFIYHDTASTTAGTFSGFPLTNLKKSGHDSHLDTENAALFNDPVDLIKFYLWNHSNNNTATAAPATGTYVAQIFNFGSTYNDVRSAKLTIASRIDEANQFVAIRELGFEAIPEPGSVFL
jgi:hypothetical protein